MMMTGSQGSKYRAAERRYGREEMLALCPPAPDVPLSLRDVPYILVERSQTPLAMLPLSAEEQVERK